MTKTLGFGYGKNKRKECERRESMEGAGGYMNQKFDTRKGNEMEERLNKLRGIIETAENR